jgi:hypothetical protein
MKFAISSNLSALLETRRMYRVACSVSSLRAKAK